MPGDAMQAKPGFNTSLMLLLVVVFINIAGFSLILPLLPFYGEALNASPFAVTTLFAAYSLGNIFGEIFWGRLSDKLGRRKILIIAISCAALTYVAFAFASVLWLALVIRVVSGFFSGTLGVCQSYIADITPPEQRAKSFGYFGAAFNLGFALGPAIGGLLARPELGLLGFRLPILTAAVFAGLAALWALFALKESRVGGAARVQKWGEAMHFVATHSLVMRLFILAFIAVGAFASMEAVFGLWTEHNFNWSTSQVGLTFIGLGTAGMLVQIFLIGPLVKRYGEARVIVFGLCILFLSMFLQPVLRAPIASVVLMTCLMMGHSLAFPNIGALVSRTAGADVQGSVNGLIMASNALARILLPPFFGFVYASAGNDIPYYLCALLIAVAIFIASQVVRIRNHEAAAISGGQST